MKLCGDTLAAGDVKDPDNYERQIPPFDCQ